MQIDDRANQFIQKAKAAGYNETQIHQALLRRGYNVARPVHKDPYSALDKAKYTLRAAGEGAALGLGDVVAGGLNAQMQNLADITHGNNWITRLKGLGKLAYNMTPQGQVAMLNTDAFKKGRADFVRKQEDFATEHPVLNLGGELIGGLITGGAGVAKTGAAKVAGGTLKSALARAAKQGAAFGGLYGAGSGLTQKHDQLSVSGALKGALSGAGTGTLFGAGADGAARAMGLFWGTKAAAQRAAQKIFDQAGGKSISDIVRADSGMKALQNAVRADKSIATTVRQLADEKLINSAEATKQIIKDTLGVQDIQKAKAAASNQYAKLIGDSADMVPMSVYNKPGLIAAAKQVRKDDVAGVLRNKGINSLEGVQRVKKNLDDAVNALVRQGKDNEAADFKTIRNYLLEKVDTRVPEYAKARADYAKAIKPYHLLENLSAIEGREKANAIKAILTGQNKATVADVFGQEKAQNLFEALRKQSTEQERFNTLYKASEHALTQADPMATQVPWGARLNSLLGFAADTLRAGGAKRLRRNIAEILLSGARPQVKGQNPDILDIYNIHVKKASAPRTEALTHRRPSIESVLNKHKNVKG